MVLDPLNAIGLTSNLIQFIDFSRKLLSESRQIYASRKGASVRHLELADAIETLISVDNRVKEALESKGSSLTADEQELKRLCENSRIITNDLKATLDRLTLFSSKHRRWASFRQAWRNVLSRDEIRHLLDRTQESRQQLDTHILICLRTSIDEVTAQQKDLHAQVSRAHQGTQHNNEHFIRERARERAANSKWQADIIDAIMKSRWQVPGDVTMDAGGQILMETKMKHFQETILNQLWFPSIPDRHEKITEAHRKTFRWIFRDPKRNGKPWTSFADWLQNGKGIYWIAGKAGSGKSTLLKYLYKHHSTEESLRYWSGSLPLRIAGFFFWNSGEEMQMSQAGLLQCLLYQLLSQDPSLISRIFPQRWLSYNLFGECSIPWSNTELLKAFQDLITEQSPTSNIFLCIDGLDEFNGDHKEFIDLLRNTASSSHVKICVSSRPWLAFEDAFGRGPRLILQDLTYPDIERFIAAMLCQNPRFIELQSRQPKHASRFKTEIAKKASGVFLWVDLVVRSLLQGLRNSDRISDLQKRLRALPDDLENVYQGLFNSIEPFYFQHASQLFQIHRAASRQLSLLDFSFADEEDIQYALKADIKPLSAIEKRFRCEEMLRRLNSRCRGFLEFSSKPTAGRRGTHGRRPDQSHHQYSSDASDSDEIDSSYASDSSQESSTSLDIYKPLPSTPAAVAETQEIDTDVLAGLKVEYIHRSARDFLEKPEIWEKVLTATATTFDAHLAICGMHILKLKTLISRDVTASNLWKQIIPCLIHFGEVDSAFDELQSPLIDQLETAMHQHGYTADFKAYLPAIVVKFGIETYIRANLKRGTFPFEDHAGEPLLDCTVLHQSRISGLGRYIDVRNESRNPPLPNVAIMKLLLEHGADPNQRYERSTPWQNLFVQAAKARPYSPAYGLELKKRWLDSIELFLQHGADPMASTDISTGRALRAAFRYENIYAARVADVQTMLKECLEGRQQAQRGTRPFKRRPGMSGEHRHILFPCFP